MAKENPFKKGGKKPDPKKGKCPNCGKDMAKCGCKDKGKKKY